MNKILKNSLLEALTLGLISGSVMAQSDNDKEPHETPHKAEPRPAAMAASPERPLIRSQIWFNFRFRTHTPRVTIT